MRHRLDHSLTTIDAPADAVLPDEAVRRWAALLVAGVILDAAEEDEAEADRQLAETM